MINITEETLTEQYLQAIPYYKAWGNIVNDKILDEITTNFPHRTLNRIKEPPRVKELKKFISKALFRGKDDYTNPIRDITDLVGVRFVVLELSEIELIQSIVESETIWDCSKDRDFTDTQLKEYKVFQYQAIHYIVRNKITIEHDGVEIPAGTPCEIQIKTMLQHAWSEITHDTIYKPNTVAPNDVKRVFHSANALIEVTDNYFRDAVTMLNKYDMFKDYFERFSKIFYDNVTSTENNVEDNVNMLVFDAYRDELTKLNFKDVESFFSNRKDLFEVINRNYKFSFLYQQPLILLIYYLLSTQPILTEDHWPFEPKYIAPFMTDMNV